MIVLWLIPAADELLAPASEVEAERSKREEAERELREAFGRENCTTHPDRAAMAWLSLLTAASAGTR